MGKREYEEGKCKNTEENIKRNDAKSQILELLFLHAFYLFPETFLK